MPTLQLSNPSGATWSASGSLSVSMYGVAGAGTQSAGLAIGGWSSTGVVATTQKFNGSAWSTSGNLGTARHEHGGTGTQNAALAVAGTSIASTEKFNGSTWSSLAAWNVSLGRYGLGAVGAQDAALVFGGYAGSTRSALAEKFNGSAWSATGSLNTARYRIAAVGTQDAALAIAGQAGSMTNSVESFNGTAWSVGTNLPTSREGSVGCGTQTNALVFGGYSTYLYNTYSFNGSAWSTSGNLVTGRYQHGGAGTSSAALAFGGNNSLGALISTTEKFVAGGDPAPLSVAEGVLANATVATLSAAEAGMVFTKVAGTGDTDNASFNISGSNLITLANFDYETKQSYSVRIQASNGTTTYQNVVAINITNVNEAPSNITLSAASIQEGNAVNAVIGQLSAIDPDTGDTSFTFSISGGADAAKFNISGNDLRASQAFDYEAPADANADNVYVVEVTAQDAGGLTYSKSFNISVSNNAADDSVTVSSSQVVSGTGGKVAASSANNPTTISFLLNGAALPVGSVVRWTAGNNQKFLKIDGSSTSFKALPVSAPASWGWSEAGEAAWATLQSF